MAKTHVLSGMFNERTLTVRRGRKESTYLTLELNPGMAGFLAHVLDEALDHAKHPENIATIEAFQKAIS